MSKSLRYICYGLLIVTSFFGCYQFIAQSSLPQSVLSQPSHTDKTSNNNIQGRIQPTEYKQFWLWKQPKSLQKISQLLEKTNTLYVLQGEITKKSVSSYATLTQQGVTALTVPDKKVWLVYRATDDQWNEDVLPRILQRLEQWEKNNNNVQGIQIDFDSPTYKLDTYAVLLKKIRTQLPQKYKLSITGLLDWANQAENTSLQSISNIVDELVIQTYQGTQTVNNYPRYLQKLEHFAFPFKVGIVEDGVWYKKDPIIKKLEKNVNFKGYVVFLYK